MNKKQNSDGFSLVELVVASGILAVLAVSVMASFGTAFKADNLSMQTRDATNSAQATLEVVNGTDFELLLALDGNVIEDSTSQSTISVTSIGSGIVRVKVASQHQMNSQANFEIVTLISDNN